MSNLLYLPDWTVTEYEIDTDDALLALRGACRETIGEIDYLRDRGDSAADAAGLAARIEALQGAAHRARAALAAARWPDDTP